MKSKSVVELTKEKGEQPLLRYVLYARKSSEDVGAQAKSLPDQIKDCISFAESHGLVVVDILKESHSAKISGKRPVFSKMLKDIKRLLQKIKLKNKQKMTQSVKKLKKL